MEFLSLLSLDADDFDYSVRNKTSDSDLLEAPCIVHVIVLGLNPLDGLFTFATT